jgi:hypothetical protein
MKCRRIFPYFMLRAFAKFSNLTETRSYFVYGGGGERSNGAPLPSSITFRTNIYNEKLERNFVGERNKRTETLSNIQFTN